MIRTLPVGILALALSHLVALTPTDSRAEDTLAKVRESGRIVLGYREDAKPFSFQDSAGKASGYSIDLCLRIVAAVRQKLGLDGVEIAFLPVTAKDRFAQLQNGSVDIVCGSTTNTLQRQEQAAFTLLTFVTGAEMLVKTDSGIADLGQVAGKTLGVLGGTTTETGLRAGLERRLVEAKIVLLSSHEDGLKALEDGDLDAYFADRILLAGLASKARDPAKLKLSGRLYSFEPYALMVRRGDDDFRLVADRALAGLYRSGEITGIYRKWFGKAKPSKLLQALFVLQSLPEQ